MAGSLWTGSPASWRGPPSTPLESGAARRAWHVLRYNAGRDPERYQWCAFNSWRLSAGAASAADQRVVLPPSLGGISADVQRFLNGPQPAMKLPVSHQWRVALERRVASGGVASVACVASTRQRLLGNFAYLEPETGLLSRFATLTRQSSDYHFMQLRYVGSLGHGAFASSGTLGPTPSTRAPRSPPFSLFVQPAISARHEAHPTSMCAAPRRPVCRLRFRLLSVRRGFATGLSGWTASGILRNPWRLSARRQRLGTRARTGLLQHWPPRSCSRNADLDKRSRCCRRKALESWSFWHAPTISGTLRRNAIAEIGSHQLNTCSRRTFTLLKSILLAS